MGGGQDQPPDLFSTPSRSAEAGLKSFFAGAVASAFLLYGIALVWGEVGRTDYFQLGTLLPGGVSTLGNIGLVFILIGFAFKVALAPFHLWALDAYQGAPAPVSGLMASAGEQQGGQDQPVAPQSRIDAYWGASRGAEGPRRSSWDAGVRI